MEDDLKDLEIVANYMMIRKNGEAWALLRSICVEKTYIGGDTDSDVENNMAVDFLEAITNDEHRNSN